MGQQLRISKVSLWSLVKSRFTGGASQFKSTKIIAVIHKYQTDKEVHGDVLSLDSWYDC